MPVSFGNPGLLFGAFAAALPVIIHFLSRRRVRRVPFSDLRFLDEVQARRARSLGIRRWLLLLLRVLAILMVALAAAAPRWGGLASTGSRTVLMVVDTSASMATRTDEGSRLDAARADARALLAALPQDAEIQVLAAGAGGEPLFGEWIPRGAGAEQGFESLAVGEAALDLPAVLRSAARQVTRAPGPTVDVVFIGDLQAAPEAEELAEAASQLAAAGEVRLLVRQVGAPVEQGGVLGVRLPGRVVLAGEPASVSARVLPSRRDQVFTLELDGRPVAEAVAAAPGVEQSLVFSFAVPAAGLHAGLVRKESDAFAADDARPFVLAVPAAIPVVIAHGADRRVDGALGRGGWRAVAEALAPGGDTSLFRVESVPTDQLTTGAVAAAALTILVDPDPLGREALDALRQDLAAGGGLLVLAGDPTQAAYLEESLLPLLGREGPAVYVNADDAAQRARVLDRGHPVTAGLGDDAVTTLEDVAWRRWFRLPAGGATVPLALAGEDPLLLSGEAGAGRWAVLPFHLRPEACDLPGSPMALPLLRRLGTWLARPAELAAAANLEVGGDLALEPLQPRGRATLDDPATLRITGPAPGEARLARLAWRGATPVLAGGVADAAGLAVFTAGPDTVGLAAVGLPAVESAPELLDAAAWAAPLRAAGLDVITDLADAAPEAVATAFAGLALAPWLLALAALLLAVELRLGRGAERST
jgi:hypothetical protein